MERTFVHVSLCRLRERPVVMEIAEPFAVFLVWKTGIRVFVYLLVHFQVFGIACGFIGIQRGDDGFALWPPELHVMPVFLLRAVLAIPKIGDSTVCFVPTPFPGPVQDREPYLLQLRVPVPVLGLFEDKPCRFDGMVRPGIESINSPFGPTVSRMALNSGFMKSRRSSAIDSSI